MNKCFYCSKEIPDNKTYCDRDCLSMGRSMNYNGFDGTCLECGDSDLSCKEFLDHIKSKHDMTYEEYAAKHFYKTVDSCCYCGNKLPFNSIRRRFRYCNRDCYSMSDIQKDCARVAFSNNRKNPKFAYANYIRYFSDVPESIYLYVISFSDKLKIGICKDFYKRSNELYRINGEDNFRVDLLLKSDTKFITYLETWMKICHSEINEYYNISELSSILSELQNINSFINLNEFPNKEDLFGDHSVEYIRAYDTYNEVAESFAESTGMNLTPYSSMFDFYPFDGGILSDYDCITKVVSIKESNIDTTRLFTINTGLVTHNCRLRLDLRELWRKGGGLFGANSQTGSIGVVTINMPQLGYLNKGNKEQFYNELNHLMILARDSLETKRSVIKKLVDKGFFPYIKHYVNSFDTCFSTIGLNGMHECILNFTDGKYGINCKEGQEFAIEVLTYMRNRLADFQEETGSLFNLEATPAEGTSYRLAMHDKKNFPEIITSGTDAAPYYTNSTWLPVDATSDIFEMLDHQEPLQTLYTGGTVAHILLGESVSDWTSVRELVKTVFTNYKIPYITISPTYSICPIHGYLSGEQHHCPKCKAEKQKKLEEEIAAIERDIKDIEIEDNR